MSRQRMRGERPLILHGERWGWIVRGGYVLIIRPDRTKVAIYLNMFLGESWDFIERSHWKGYATPITPANIRAHIESGVNMKGSAI